MKLTRQHFEAIASLIKRLPKETTQNEVALAFAYMFQDTNPNFNLVRFVKASTTED